MLHKAYFIHFESLYSASSEVINQSQGPSIKYVTLFWTNFDPLPLSHISGPLPKVRHTSRTTPPIFSRPSTCIHTYVFTEGLFQFAEGFVRGALSRVFCLEGFVRQGLFYCNCKYDDLYSTVSSKLLLGCFTRLLNIKARGKIEG